MPVAHDAYGDAGRAPVRADRFEPDYTVPQLDFGGPAAPAAEYSRAPAILASVAIAGIGAIAAIAYFAGIIAAGIAVAAVAALIGFGNWVLNNTADLM
jgi:hypothetical protein